VTRRFSWALALFVGACGAAPARDLHAAFASIQVDEARIEHASAQLESSGDERAQGAARDEICDAASHLEATAAPLDDRDAHVRSVRASEACTNARTRVATP
jgi:hypothetical protein